MSYITTTTATNNTTLTYADSTTSTTTADTTVKSMTPEQRLYREINNIIPTIKLTPKSITFTSSVITKPDEIYSIKEIVPNKIYQFIFYDNTKIKTICAEEDIFDFRYACFLAIAKKKYSREYTFEGVLKKAEELSYLKEYNKQVDKAIKYFYLCKEEKAKKEEWDRIQKRKHDKLVERKIRKKERKKKEQINIIKEAIELANKGDK